MALNDEEGRHRPIFLEFDLAARKLTAYHNSHPEMLLKKLQPLGFGASLITTQELSEDEVHGLKLGNASDRDKSEAKVLKILLGINAILFLLEITLGIFAQSTGLIADSMDMFADATVYGLSLYAVGRAQALQRRAARISGYMQMLLSVGALLEILRRLIVGNDPQPGYMMGVALLALIANAICLLLISKHRDGGVHMQASLIFSANDVIANLGVILAGFLVAIFKSPVPDLLIGLVIAVVVFRGSVSILKISRPGA